MKKILALLLALLCVFGLAACNRDGDGSGNVDLAKWEVLTGGKMYENPISGEGKEYYSDGKAESSGDGIVFSGTGGYWSKADGTSGAACGGIYKTAIDLTKGDVKIEFTVNELSVKLTMGTATTMWDSWITFGIMNQPKYFTTNPTNDAGDASGIIFQTKVYDKVQAEGLTYTHQKFDRIAGWNGVVIKESPMPGEYIGVKHTWELKKGSDELGSYYSVYWDGNKLDGWDISEDDIKKMSESQEIYLSMSMQSWNASPSASDGDAEKNYKSNKFTIHSITQGDTKLF